MLAIAVALTLITTACGDDSGTTDGGADPTPTDQNRPDDGSSDTGEPTDRSAELTGSWAITTFQLAGALGEATPLDSAPASIEFTDDGTFTFSNGCNTGDGEWDARGLYQPPNDDGLATGQAISFGNISQTEIGCEADLADQDLAIGGAIRAADLFTLEDGALTLWRDGNVMIAAMPA